MDLWYCRADEPLDESLRADLRSLLPPDEQARVDRFYRPEHRQLSLLARVLVRRVLAQYAGVDPRTLAFAVGPYGKPYVTCPAEFSWAFNLSHTNGMVVLAVSPRGAVGVDVESISRDINIDLAERYFAPPECAALRKLSVEEQSAAFLRYWTLKEAFIKALGTGLSTPLSDFAFRLSDEDPPQIQFIQPALGHGQSWRFAEVTIEPHYRVAIAQYDQIPSTDPLRWNLRRFRPNEGGASFRT